jgi:hypothetical protein
MHTHTHVRVHTNEGAGISYGHSSYLDIRTIVDEYVYTWHMTAPLISWHTYKPKTHGHAQEQMHAQDPHYVDCAHYTFVYPFAHARLCIRVCLLGSLCACVCACAC